MGIEDRDYYWEDRKRRENKYKKSGSNSSPNELKKIYGGTSGKPSSLWQGHGEVEKTQWMLLFAFLAGGFVTLWIVMIVLHINANFLYLPYEMTRKVLSAIGAL